MNMQQTVIIIAGPTASGKTDFSLKLASYFNTSIISADSRQCFKELNIGVAKPPPEVLKSVKHYFINSHSVHDIVNARVFEEYALKASTEIFKQNDTSIMVGGTGMYIKAFCEGLDSIPGIDPGIREEINNEYKENGLLWLQQQVQQKDPVFWQYAEQKNPQRLMRALEVVIQTGKSITDFRKKNKGKRNFLIKKFGISLPKEKLHANIEQRTDEMIKDGLIEEAKLLTAYKNINALQTVGYKEIFDYLENKTSLASAIEFIKKNTKQYAKRQLTWFKKDKEIKWLGPEQISNFPQSIEQALNE